MCVNGINGIVMMVKPTWPSQKSISITLNKYAWRTNVQQTARCSNKKQNKQQPLTVKLPISWMNYLISFLSIQFSIFRSSIRSSTNTIFLVRLKPIPRNPQFDIFWVDINAANYPNVIREKLKTKCYWIIFEIFQQLFNNRVIKPLFIFL